MPLATSARICAAERASSKGHRATDSPWSEANRALVKSGLLNISDIDERAIAYEAAFNRRASDKREFSVSEVPVRTP